MSALGVNLALGDYPLAALFPLMEGDAANELAEDIAANGQQESIMLYQGKILDGRNRYRACLAAGVEPITKEFVGDDPLSFVVSRNIHRRHLTTSQRAMIAAELANMRSGQRTDLEPSVNSRKVSQSEAADKLNVSRDSVTHAATVKTHDIRLLGLTGAIAKDQRIRHSRRR